METSKDEKQNADVSVGIRAAREPYYANLFKFYLVIFLVYFEIDHTVNSNSIFQGYSINLF